MSCNRIKFISFVILFFLLPACSGLSDSEQADLLPELRTLNETEFLETLTKIERAGEPAFTAPLIDLMWAGQIGIDVGGVVTPTLEAVTDQMIDGDWVDWLAWYSQSLTPAPTGYTEWKGGLMGEIDPDFADFFVEPVASSFNVEEVVWGGVIKDGIPALMQAEQLPITIADGYTPQDAVFGISVNGDHRAYPLRVMDWHEMANDVVGGVPIALSYCTLCGSAIVYKTDHPAVETPLTFGSSGLLYRSNKLMYDHQTNTVWNQLTGEPVMGPLVGVVDQLEILPIVTTTLTEWASQHPLSTVLSMETGYFRDYTPGAAYGEYFVRDTLLFPVGEVDARLPAKEQVLAVEIGGEAKAYPLAVFNDEPILNDTVGGVEIVLIANLSRINVHGYSYELEYISYNAGAEIRVYERGNHRFERLDDRSLADDQGGAWEMREEALVWEGGDMVELLDRVPAHISFWFGWQSFYPDTGLYERDATKDTE